MPFREAHHVTGRIVAMAAGARHRRSRSCSLDDMQSIEPRITDEVFEVLGVESSVRSRVSYGGTAPDKVRTQARLAEAHRQGASRIAVIASGLALSPRSRLV